MKNRMPSRLVPPDSRESGFSGAEAVPDGTLELPPPANRFEETGPLNAGAEFAEPWIHEQLLRPGHWPMENAPIP